MLQGLGGVLLYENMLASSHSFSPYQADARLHRLTLWNFVASIVSLTGELWSMRS